MQKKNILIKVVNFNSDLADLIKIKMFIEIHRNMDVLIGILKELQKRKKESIHVHLKNFKKQRILKDLLCNLRFKKTVFSSEILKKLCQNLHENCIVIKTKTLPSP